jgi:uncharacterized secreted protein with C-terminal beta-propeller domain
MRAVGRFLPIATVLLLAGCSGSPEKTGKTPVEAPPMRLVAYDGCAELLTGLRAATEKQVATLGGGYDGDMITRGGPEAAEAPQAQEGNKSGQAAPHSGTNVHEIGADEPDLVKTDGDRIVVLANRSLVVLDPATRTVRHRMKLPEELQGSAHMFLKGDRALIFGTTMQAFLREGPVRPPETRMVLVDLSGEPRVLGTMTSRASFLDARMTGSIARVVVQSRPDIDFPQPDPAEQPTGDLLERRKAAVRAAPLSAWLPTFTVDGRSHTVPCERVSRPADSPGASLLTVLTVDLARGLGDPGAVSVATDGNVVYGNGSSLYVVGGQHRLRSASSPRVDLHKFDVRGTGLPRYLASGSVPGHLLNQYSLSEHAGHLRVATTSYSAKGGGGSESSVHVLRQNGPRLDTVGRVDGLGKHERIYSVRFLGATGYVVTFRQVDPLYVVDLNDPAKPKVTGELKIAGYSAYLHPLPGNRLLGVGQDADARGRTLGTQVSLFDVSGPPKRLSNFRLPGASSQAEFDPHAFLHWPQSGLTVIPVSRGYTGATQAQVLSVTAAKVTGRGSVDHPGIGAIQRSLMVGDTLWTISQTGARATDPQTLASRAWLPY